jgi:hypothetical protein
METANIDIYDISGLEPQRCEMGENFDLQVIAKDSLLRHCKIMTKNA